MKLEIGRYSIKIIPENEQDEAYIIDTLGLKKKDETVPLKRIAVMGIDTAIAYLEAKKE